MDGKKESRDVMKGKEEEGKEELRKGGSGEGGRGGRRKRGKKGSRVWWR